MNKWDRRFMDLARLVSTWSKDPSTQTGAVLVGKNRNVLSTGFNGFPRRIQDTHERLHDRQVKYGLIIHAEKNAIYNAVLNGVCLEGSTAYVVGNGIPVCDQCSLGLIQVGVIRVVYDKNLSGERGERWKESCERAFSNFREAFVEVECEDPYS